MANFSTGYVHRFCFLRPKQGHRNLALANHHLSFRLEPQVMPSLARNYDAVPCYNRPKAAMRRGFEGRDF